MDYIGHPKSALKAVAEYNKNLENGWTPMSVDDLRLTAGVCIDHDTVLDVGELRVDRYARYLLNILGMSLGVLLGYQTSRIMGV